MIKLFHFVLAGFGVLFISQSFATINADDLLLLVFPGQYELLKNDNESDCAQTIAVFIGERGIVVKDISEQWSQESIFFSDINQGIKERHIAFSERESAQGSEKTTFSGNNDCFELKYALNYKDTSSSCNQTTSITLDVRSGALSYQHRDCRTDRLPLGNKGKQQDYPSEPQNFDKNCLYGKAGREETGIELKKCTMQARTQ